MNTTKIKEFNDKLRTDLTTDKQFQVEFTDIFPYMDERTLTDEVLEELGFERIEVSKEEVVGEDEDFYYYSLDLFPDDIYNDLALMSGDNNVTQEVVLFPYEKPVFKTAGGLKTILMGLQGE